MPPTHLPSTPVFPSDNQPPLRFTGYSENLCRFWIKWETWFILEYFLWKKFFRFKNIHWYQRYIFDFMRGGDVSLPSLLSFPQVFRVFLSGGELNLSGLQTVIADFRSTFILMIIWVSYYCPLVITWCTNMWGYYKDIESWLCWCFG